MRRIRRFAPCGPAPQPVGGNRCSLATVFAVIFGAVWLFLAIDPSTLESPDVIDREGLAQKLGQTPGPSSPAPGKRQRSGTYRTITLLVLGLGASVLIARRREAWGLLRRFNPPLLVFLMLVPLSLLWSIDPPNTLAHSISVLCFAVFLAAGTRGMAPAALLPEHAAPGRQPAAVGLDRPVSVPP